MSSDGEAEETVWAWDLLKLQLEGFNPVQYPQVDLLRRYVERDPVVMKQIVGKSCEYLELIFYNNLIGGSSTKEGISLLSLIDAYTKSTLRLGLKELPEKFEELEVESSGWPVFVIIYYLIRAGQHKEALEFARKTQHKPAEDFANLYSIFLECEGSLPGEELNKALQVLEARYEMAIDPYKQALYIILSKQHKEPNKLLQPFMDDYLWFYLKIVVFDNEEELAEGTRAAYIPLPLGKFQQSILEMTLELNAAEKDPFGHFKTLLLVGLYDHAIKHLTNYTTYFAHCMHYAIVMNEVGVLPNTTLYEACGISAEQLEDTAVIC